MPARLRFVALVGDKSGSGVKITESNSAGDSSLDECTTFTLLASNVVVSNIVFENAFGPGEQGSDETQAVAIKVAGTRVAFYDCTFLGYQDTLYATIGLQYYKNCIIQGRVDFIFGNAKALFHDCKFRLVTWGGGYFAQARDEGQDTGFVVLGGSLAPYGPGPIKPGYLARSWGDFSTVVFIKTYFAAGAVRPEGWGYVGGYKDFDEVTFGVYGCFGPGYNTSQWEDWAKVYTAAEAAPFSSISYVNKGNWIIDPALLTRGVSKSSGVRTPDAVSPGKAGGKKSTTPPLVSSGGGSSSGSGKKKSVTETPASPVSGGKKSGRGKSGSQSPSPPSPSQSSSSGSGKSGGSGSKRQSKKSSSNNDGKDD
eukprot:TRINITY_DN7815_c0_g1_i1.p1 TRINITY_DN7815_c0_g1~~TRINITY_DN7815_c0_g1_i1.p1  ORF type:complete len:429 (-),score=23.75 TRINITY_DN7815_c0_g1_i1:334-1434(-)